MSKKDFTRKYPSEKVRHQPLLHRHPEDFPGEYRPASRMPFEGRDISDVSTEFIPYADLYADEEPLIDVQRPNTNGYFVLVAEGRPHEFVQVVDGCVVTKPATAAARQSYTFKQYQSFRRSARPDLQVFRLKEFPAKPPTEG